MALVDHKVSSLNRPSKKKRYANEVDDRQHGYQPYDHIFCYPMFHHMEKIGQIWKPYQDRPCYTKYEKEYRHKKKSPIITLDAYAEILQGISSVIDTIQQATM